MPTNLHRYPSPSAEFYAKQKVQRLEQATRGLLLGQAPFLGYCPDLPPRIAGLGGAQSCEGLVARERTGHGEFLTNDDGFVEIDAEHSPFGGGRALVGCEDFRLADGSIQPVMIWAGNGGASAITMMKLLSTGLFSTLAADAAVVTVSNGTRESLWDMCPFPYGAPTRDYGTLNGIATPIMVMCNGNATGPKDPVLITPTDPSIATPTDKYSELWQSGMPGSTGAALAYPFKAKSCETFNGRVHFFNTSEGGINYSGRLRGTAIGTADPNPLIVGAYRIDFYEFEGQGLRIETLGHSLACYFTDGVAIVTQTGDPFDPYRYEIVGRYRGLLSTHAVTPVGASIHFGIFDDGWWKLNAAGQWQPCGALAVRESGERDVLYYKWRQTFYDMLDWNQRHLITTTFDYPRRRVLIAWPRIGDTRMQLWSYDIDTDRVWPLGNSMDLTQWGLIARPVRAALRYADLTGTYEDYETAGTRYEDWDAKYSYRGIVHGNSTGFIFGWDQDITTQDGLYPSWYWTSHHLATSEDFDREETLHKFQVEYQVPAPGSPGFSVQATMDPLQHTETRSIAIPADRPQNAMGVGYAMFRLHGTHHSFQLSGSAPVRIRSFGPTFISYGITEGT